MTLSRECAKMREKVEDMTDVQILMWAMGGGFAAMFALQLYILSDIRDIDRRLCRLEGAFMNKDCCMIKSDSQIKKAE